jgi:hypothetical protein
MENIDYAGPSCVILEVLHMDNRLRLRRHARHT